MADRLTGSRPALGGTSDRREFLTSVAALTAGVVIAGGRDDDRAWAPIEVVQALTGRADQADRVWLSALLKPGPAGPAPDPVRDPAGEVLFAVDADDAGEVGDDELIDEVPGVEPGIRAHAHVERAGAPVGESSLPHV